MGESDQVVFQADVDANDLETAKHAAFNILCAEPAQRLFQVRGLEIWQSGRRLYPVPYLSAS
jgi:hypothetical protein